MPDWGFIRSPTFCKQSQKTRRAIALNEKTAVGSRTASGTRMNWPETPTDLMPCASQNPQLFGVSLEAPRFSVHWQSTTAKTFIRQSDRSAPFSPGALASPASHLDDPFLAQTAALARITSTLDFEHGLNVVPNELVPNRANNCSSARKSQQPRRVWGRAQANLSIERC